VRQRLLTISRPGFLSKGERIIRGLIRSERLIPYWMLAPLLVGLAILVYSPMIGTFALSFLRYFWNKPQQPIRWAGLNNYIDIFSESLFWQAFGNTIVFMIVSTGLSVLIGLGLAVMFDRKFPGKNVFMTLILLPMMTFRVFDFIYIMTNGGPGGKTETIGFLSYERTFRHFNMGQGSVIAIFILVVVLLISWYFIRILQKGLLEQVR